MTIKLCPRCGQLAHYNSYFGAWICSVCDYRFDQVERDPIRALQETVAELTERLEKLEKREASP